MAASDLDSNQIYRSGSPLTLRAVLIVMVTAGLLYTLASMFKP